MKKTYNIEIDCPNCANLVEGAANKVEGVESAIINFMTQKMIIDFVEGYNEKKVLKAIHKTGRKIESGFEIEY